MDFIECENATITMPAEEVDINKSKKQEFDQAPAIFPCISCDSVFLKREECRQHMREHAREKTLSCRYCKQSLPCMKQLLSHLKGHREDSSFSATPSGNDDDNQRVEDGPLPRKSVIAKLKRPTGIRGRKKGTYVYSRTCTDCGEVFMSTATLKNHKKLHNAGKLLYSCSYCSYRSDFPSAVEKHLKKKHENLKMLYKCALCKYVAIRISLLKSHVTLNQHFDT